MPLWERLRQFWTLRLDALGIELARGRRLRGQRQPHKPTPPENEDQHD